MNYNDDLEKKCEKIKANREIEKAADEEEILRLIGENKEWEEQVERLIEIQKEKESKIKAINEDHQGELRELNSKHLVLKEEQLDAIQKEQEKLDDIQNWLQVEDVKTSEKNKLAHELGV